MPNKGTLIKCQITTAMGHLGLGQLMNLFLCGTPGSCNYDLKGRINKSKCGNSGSVIDNRYNNIVSALDIKW